MDSGFLSIHLLDWFLSASFNAAIARSLIIAVSVVLVSIVVGLPLGTLSGLYAFCGRRMFLGLLALPLLVPSFLWAIGFSQIQDMFHFSMFPLDSKIARGVGPVITFSAFVIPLAVYASFLSVKSLSKNQIDAFRLVGSDRWTFLQLMKRAAPITFLITLLAGIITLSDPGPGQIFGFSGAASEILVSFSALYDFDLARTQSLILALVSILVCLPFILWIGPRLSVALLAKEATAELLMQNAMLRWLAPLLFILILFLILGIPFLGLIKPLVRGFSLDYALRELLRTGFNTVFYALSAGLVGTAIATSIILLFGRILRATQIISLALFILVVPATFLAVSIIQMGSTLSASWDWLFRSRLIIGLVLGVHFCPIAILLILKRYNAISDSWFDAAKTSGVPRLKFIVRVIVPFLLPAIVLSAFIISLLASAEIGTVLLLRPPGEDSFPLRIFTVMANASESVVSTLCLLYVGLAGIFLVTLWYLIGRKPA